MPLTLLPASAAAFAPRSAPTIVLGSRVESWLTQTLKRVNRIKRPINSVPQHYRFLTETLSGPSAIWTLASLMVPKVPDTDLQKDDNDIVAALLNYQLISVEAYVVHVDMVSEHEIAWKLTQDTIDALIEYHKEIYSVDVAANTWKWPEKEQQLKKLQEEFKQAVNRFVYRTNVRALEGLEEEGAGELLEGRSREVKDAIMALFLPLLPPPPRIVEVVQSAPVYHYAATGPWYHHPMPAPMMAHPEPPSHLQAPVDPWRVLGSTPSPTSTSVDSYASPWSAAPVMENSNSSHGTGSSAHNHSVSPVSSYGQPYNTSQGQYGSPHAVAPQMALPYPSAIASQCGPSATMSPAWNHNFAWSQNDFMPQTPIYI